MRIFSYIIVFLFLTALFVISVCALLKAVLLLMKLLAKFKQKKA